MTEGPIITSATIEHLRQIKEKTDNSLNLLQRPWEELLRLRPNTGIIEDENRNVKACLSFKLWTPTLAELVMLITDFGHNEKGLAPIMLNDRVRFIQDRYGRNIDIFALVTKDTAERIFFKNGFFQVGIQFFSSKVTTDCQKCPKNRINDGEHSCNEIAVLLKK
jgi:hypothetical protein